MFEAFASERLESKGRRDYLRSLNVSGGIDFSSNDYLGFARSEALLEEFKRQVLALTQLGSTGSRLLSGNHQLHQETEDRLARTFGAQRALLFSSGYLLNLGLLQCLGAEGSVLLLDELCHASLKEGARASKGETYFFRHNDLDHLRGRLQRHQGKKCFVVVESVYSMDGDLGPLEGIVRLAEDFGAEVIVDEAHGVGVIGEDGLGLVSELGLGKRVLARVITFGKALGAEGAAVLGSAVLARYLANFCPTFIYTTGVSFPTLLMVNAALDKLAQSELDRVKLRENISSFSRKTKLDLESPIVSWPTSSRERTLELAARLRSSGFNVFPIFSPTVRKGSERIRIILHSFNTEAEIESLLATLEVPRG